MADRDITSNVQFAEVGTNPVVGWVGSIDQMLADGNGTRLLNLKFIAVLPALTTVTTSEHECGKLNRVLDADVLLSATVV